MVVHDPYLAECMQSVHAWMVGPLPYVYCLSLRSAMRDTSTTKSSWSPPLVYPPGGTNERDNSRQIMQVWQVRRQGNPRAADSARADPRGVPPTLSRGVFSKPQPTLIGEPPRPPRPLPATPIRVVRRLEPVTAWKRRFLPSLQGRQGGSCIYPTGRPKA
jgi:hypothetical protein